MPFSTFTEPIVILQKYHRNGTDRGLYRAELSEFCLETNVRRQVFDGRTGIGTAKEIMNWA